MEVLVLTMVGAHGLTDMVIGYNDPGMWLMYGSYGLCSFFLPLPVCAAGFLVHSAAHFSADVGVACGSLTSLVIPPLIIATAGLVTAVRVELAYLTLLHVPLHYMRVWSMLVRSPLAATIIIGAGHAIIAAWMAVRRKLRPVRLSGEPWYLTCSHAELRIVNALVCAHVAYNALSSRDNVTVLVGGILF